MSTPEQSLMLSKEDCQGCCILGFHTPYVLHIPVILVIKDSHRCMNKHGQRFKGPIEQAFVWKAPEGPQGPCTPHERSGQSSVVLTQKPCTRISLSNQSLALCWTSARWEWVGVNSLSLPSQSL